MITKLAVIGNTIDTFQNGKLVKRTPYRTRFSALRRAVVIVARMVEAGLNATIARVTE